MGLVNMTCPGMRNFKLTMEYDGTDFSGWQVQPQRRTIQGELYRAIERLATGRIRIVGAGRTDAGVHAAGQAANALFQTALGAEAVRRALSHYLPQDIRIKSVEEVDLSFNARYDAVSRTYSYIFIRRPTALWRRYFMPVSREMDIEAMRNVLKAIQGRHDFTSFSSSGGGGSTVCDVLRTELSETPPLVAFSITADRFLYKMVRTIAGTLLEAGQGKKVDVADILSAGNRKASGRTLPPNALYFMKAEY